MLKKIALITYIVGSITTALIVVDDYLGPSSNFNIPRITFYIAWLIGLAGLILNIIYSFKNHFYLIAIILILISLPWILPIFVLSWYGGIAIVTYVIIGIIIHVKPSGKRKKISNNL